MKKTSKKAFSLVELIVVVVIIGILSGVAYIGIQKARSKTMNDKVLDDVIGIANALERYNQDHFGVYPVPTVDGNMNISCFYDDATYAHDCDTSAFRQGMIDNNLLSRRYMPDVPTDPRTGSRYVYGVSTDGKYFMVGGNYEESDGSFVAKTAGNLKKGYHLPSLIRAFNGPNFVMEDGTNLPYSPDHLIITAALRNIDMTGGGSVLINDNPAIVVTDGLEVTTGDTIKTIGNATLDIYYSDGSISNLDTGSEMEILEGTEVEENDEDGIITKIRIKLTSGKIWNKVARLASASEFNVETTTAIAGVRGTEFGVDANDDILIYSGSICTDGTKTCTSPIEVDAGDPPITINLHTSAVVTNTGLETLMDEQSKRYLNDNIRPHILKVDGLEITVANLRTYYGITGDDVSEAEFLAAFEISGNPTGDSISITPLDNDDYKLTLASAPSTPIILRFEDVSGPSSGDSIPITITADTFLTEEDLYAVDEEVGEGMAEEESCIGAPEIAGYVQAVPSGDDFNITLNWSVTPDCAFDDLTDYIVTFGGEPDVTVTGNTQHPIGVKIAGDYSWSVTASDVDGDPSFTETYITPTTPTWCGDGALNGDEECDSTSTAVGESEGCNAPGADECTCNIDLGWVYVGTGCVCTPSTPTITLNTTTEVPINSALIWDVSPVCAAPSSYSVEIFEGTVSVGTGGSATTSFPLTSLPAGTLTPGPTSYSLEIDGYVVGDFNVKCPTTGTIALTSPAVSATIESADLVTTQFSWSSDPECYFDSADDYNFEIWNVDGTPFQITSCTDTVLAAATSPSATLETTCITALTAGNYKWKVIRNNYLAASQVSERNFEITAPASTFTVQVPQTYYQKFQLIPFTVMGYDSVSASGGIWNSSTKEFQAIESGTYTLTPLNGTTPDDENAVTVTFCGYTGTGDSECWVLGSESGPLASDYGQSCDEVCNAMALTCDATTTTIDLDICTAFSGSSIGGGSIKVFAPLIQSSGECNSATSTTSCSAGSEDIVPGVIHSSRICKCYEL